MVRGTGRVNPAAPVNMRSDRPAPATGGVNCSASSTSSAAAAGDPRAWASFAASSRWRGDLQIGPFRPESEVSGTLLWASSRPASSLWTDRRRLGRGS